MYITFYFERRYTTAFSDFVFSYALDYSIVFNIGFGYGEYLTIATSGHQK